MAVALPVRTSIKDVYDDTCTELLVTSQLDSGAPPVQSGLLGVALSRLCPQGNTAIKATCRWLHAHSRLSASALSAPDFRDSAKRAWL